MRRTGWRRIALYTIGQWRLAEAAYTLCRQIDYTSPLDPLLGRGPHVPLTDYPAAGALVEIGSPAMRAILTERMAEEIPDDQLRLFAWVIYKIDGRELGLTRLNLEAGQRGRTTSWTKEKNLARLIEILQSHRL